MHRTTELSDSRPAVITSVNLGNRSAPPKPYPIQPATALPMIPQKESDGLESVQTRNVAKRKGHAQPLAAALATATTVLYCLMLILRTGGVAVAGPVGFGDPRASSLSSPQELRQLLAVGHLRLNTEQAGHEIDAAQRDRDSQKAEQNQSDATALPFISGDFIHVVPFA